MAEVKTDEQRLKDLRKALDELNTNKIRAEQEYNLLKDEYNKLVEELKNQGITNIEDLPEIIKTLETKFQSDLNNAEVEIDNIQKRITNIQTTVEN